jgi:uncharacterized membrane protein
LEQVVSFLFKYRAAVFSKGRLVFGARPAILLALLIVVAVGALIYFAYYRGPKERATGGKWLLTSLRVLLITVILFCLMRPAIVVPSVLPQSTFVAILMDDTASMKIADEDGGRTRLDAVKQLMAPDGRFVSSLSGEFKVKMYKFSTGVDSVQSPGELSGTAQQTDIAGSLDQAAKNLTGLPVSGIVLITDGAQNSNADLTTTLGNLRSRGLPVFTVGVGSRSLAGDVELASVSAPRRVLAGSTVSAELLVKANGIKDQAVKVDLAEDGHPLKSQEVPLSAGESTQVVRISFAPTSAGMHKYSFTVPPLESEPVKDNNSQELLIDVENSHPRILYVEGEPRWEYGKIRGAMAEEKNVILVSLLRSAEGKFYRQSVDGPDELGSGFPKSQQDLFKYDAIVLGSTEATFFTFDQLRAIEEFVSRRGGGLLALGGARSFDGGGYLNTPMADVFPVYLTGQSVTEWESQTFRAMPSDRGRDNPVAKLQEGSEANQKAWSEMPAITLPEVLTTVKPGATVLLQAQSSKDRNKTVPLLVDERYGRGRSMAFLASDTWRWRMMLEYKNNSFDTFWRNLLRYLVQSVRQSVEVTTERGFYTPGEQVRISALVADNKYMNVSDATVRAHVTSPSGRGTDVVLSPATQQDFEGYTGNVPADEEGTYKVSVTAERAKGSSVELPLTTATTEFLVGQMNREAFGAAQNSDLLKRISAETGGAYYSPDTAANLAEDMSHIENASSVRETKDLWDMPINFLLLVGLASAEWFLRKRKGLA